MHVDSYSIIEKEKRFREFQLWPLSSTLDARRWLSNFSAEHQNIAVRLLEGFIYLADPIVDALLNASIQQYVNIYQNANDTPDAVANTLFVTVEGETPRISDSGHLFARKLRDRIGISESRIKTPAEALELINLYRNIVFVDDFIGSGQQILHTWRRQHHSTDAVPISFDVVNRRGKHSFYYCCVVCSSNGKRNVSRDIPALEICAAHVLEPEDNLLYPSHPIWRDSKEDIYHIVKLYSERAGYYSEDGGDEDWRGFGAQSIGLAFAHGTPDATLPIFRSSRNDWKPLVGFAI